MKTVVASGLRYKWHIIVIILLCVVMHLSVQSDDRDEINADALSTGLIVEVGTDSTEYYQVKALVKSVRELKDEFSDYREEFETTGESVRKLTTIVRASMKVRDTFIVTPIVDTVWLSDGMRVNVSDTYMGDFIHITRQYNAMRNEALYNYTYTPKLNVYTSAFRVGKWRLINLLKRRALSSKVTIKCDDPRMVIEDIEYIEIKD